jgi:glycosyltransferase involved in cell wall biosynthesis
MRVAYVSTIERGGPVSHLRQLAPRVAEQGVDVRVLCANENVAASFRSIGVEAEAAPVGHKLDLRGGRDLSRRLAGADLVHTHDRRAGLYGRIGGRLRGARVLHTLHGMPEEIAVRVGRPDAPVPPGVSRARLEWLLHGYLPLEASLARLGDVVTPSRAMADFMLEHGFPERLVHVIPFGAEPGEPRASRDGGRTLVAGVAANLEHWKGIDTLLEAAAKARSPVRLEIYGTGSQRDVLERQARELGVEARFHGFVADLREPFAGLDVLVQPSRADNFPLAVLEAMAAGLPVVGARVGGIPELVLDGETGLLVEPEDPAALAAALDSLAESPERREALGRRGRERVAETFTVDAYIRRTIELYEELCGSST